ncbi:MAG: NAD-dependent epimerase/dehydratase family protein, partial [Rhodothermales bacterium]
MKILITGICGFVGSSVARRLLAASDDVELVGLDNFSRPGSEGNRAALIDLGIDVRHGDLRCREDVEALPQVDWIVDAAANPSVLAGIDGGSRQVVENNLTSTINLLETCRRTGAGFILLSTSRVYSIDALNAVPLLEEDRTFVVDASRWLPDGLSEEGISESFSTSAPVSLYGATKSASESLALEYGAAFDFPVWIDRCGVMAGAGQFARADQGIVAFWIHSFCEGSPLRYIGYGGTGHQTRDCFHPHDLADLLRKQMSDYDAGGDRIYNLGGGRPNAFSLATLTAWCEDRYGAGDRAIGSVPETRAFDVPWVVMDASEAAERWTFRPSISKWEIFD